MGQDVRHELDGQLQQPSRCLHRGGRVWTRHEEGAQLVGDGQSLGSVFVAGFARRVHQMRKEEQNTWRTRNLSITTSTTAATSGGLIGLAAAQGAFRRALHSTSKRSPPACSG